jgi:tetratricopeptide (TPR) repeat protein
MCEASSIPIIGQTLGHYRIIEKVGAGGMGEVYRAYDQHLERDVALKILPAGVLPNESSKKRFRREALALSKLNHPGIATVFDFDTQGDVDFLVMEFVVGASLADRLRVGAMREKELCLLGTQIAAALEEAHEQGVIHRDLKPQNILVTSKGHVKVLDFGLAKLLRPEGTAELTASITETEAIAGTLPYMAPEQLRGEPADARTDIWAVGAVLYEMATGQRPFLEQLATRLADDILHKAPAPPLRINPNLSQKLEAMILKCMEKDADNRYQSAKELGVDLRRLAAPSAPAVDAIAPRNKRRAWLRAALAAGIVVVLVAIFVTFYFHKVKALTERDTILLGDITNTTGETAFNGTLKQALAVELGQSPFLNLLPEQQVRETLRYMGRAPDVQVTGDIAREVCQRRGLKAMLTGTVSKLGAQYVIALEAVGCQTGDSLAREQVEADRPERVLIAVDKAAAHLRAALGESLSSIQKFDVPLVQATTPSLEAFRAYTLGREQASRGDYGGSIPFFKRAIELDSNFASAYANLGVAYMFIGRGDLVTEYTRKAFALRERVSEREKFHISSRYYDSVTGELDKSIETMEVWRQTYPHDNVPANNLGFEYERMGELEKAAAEYRDAIALDPQPAIPYQNLGRVLLSLNHPAEAKAVLEEAVAKNQDFINTHLWLFEVAFEQGDAAAMQRQVDWAAGKPDESGMLEEQAMVAVFEGKFARAGELIRQANQLVARNNSEGEAAANQAYLTEHEALFGECRPTHEAQPPPTDEPDRDTRLMLATALAACGQTRQATAQVEDLAKRSPTDLVLNAADLPAVRAWIELNSGNPDRALGLLRIAGHFERVRPDITYLRGLTFLRLGKGAEAEAEFLKVSGPRGYDPLDPVHSLSYLGLARAYALAGETADARKAYEDVLAVWKDADPDVPVLRAAKAEYASLK